MQRSNFNERAQSACILVPIGDGIFYSVLFTYYTFYRLTDWGPLDVAQLAPPLIHHSLGGTKSWKCAIQAKKLAKTWLKNS